MGVLALIVIFQPEIRRALEQLGRGSFLNAIHLIRIVKMKRN